MNEEKEEQSLAERSRYLRRQLQNRHRNNLIITPTKTTSTKTTPSPSNDDGSPTSIVTVSLASTPPSRLNPTIAMSEHGAEVTLNNSSSSEQRDDHHAHSSDDENKPPNPVVVRNGKNILSRTNALLDSEITPSPHKKTNNKDRSTPDPIVDPIISSGTIVSYESPKKVSFCGIAAECFHKNEEDDSILVLDDDDDDKSTATTQQQVMEGKITNFLGSPINVDTWFHGWQAWSYFELMQQQQQHDTSGKKNDAAAEESRELKENIQRVLRNRAFDLNARNRRLDTLKRNLSPFQPSPITKAQSFNSAAPATSRQNHGVAKDVNWIDVPSDREVSLWHCGLHCSIIEDDISPIKQKLAVDLEHDGCYDSDPEDFTTRRPFNSNAKDSSPRKPSRLEESEDVTVTRYPYLIDLGNENDDDAVQQLVQELMNERMTLVLHENNRNSVAAKSLGSHAVHVWIERGQKLTNHIIPPKLVWRSIQTTNSKRRNVAFQSQQVNSVPLLDIHRILVCNKIDRVAHPFARARATFLIKTLDQTLLFEACSTTERDRLVKSLKLVVARLASQLLSNDNSIVEEFFVCPRENQGPGDSPYWLNDTE